MLEQLNNKSAVGGVTRLATGRAVQASIANDPGRGGTIAEAMSLFAEEVNELESALKGLYHRAEPFLEPVPTSGEGQFEGPLNPGASPLAGAISEYVLRLRACRLGLRDIEKRLAY